MKMRFDINDNVTTQLGENQDGKIFLTTLPNGELEIHVGQDKFNGTIVATGVWAGYNKDLTRNTFEYLYK